MCEGDPNELEVRTDAGCGKPLLQYIWNTCVFVQEGTCRVTDSREEELCPQLRNPVKDAGDHMPPLLNLFNQEAHSPFSFSRYLFREHLLMAWAHDRNCM